MAKGLETQSESFTPPSLDAHSAYEWRQLTCQVLRSRSAPHCSNVNTTLHAAAGREPQSPVAPAYHIWMADNLARDGLFSEAIAAYDASIDSCERAPRLVDDHDALVGVLHSKAAVAESNGEIGVAIEALVQASRRAPHDSGALFRAGTLAESQGDADRAAELYRRIAASEVSSATDDPAQLARRALQLLEVPETDFAADPNRLADELITALDRRDVRALQAAASTTHFMVGPLGGHTSFDTQGVLDELFRDLSRSRVTARGSLQGSGDKRYLYTRGWRGKWFRGDVVFLLMRMPRGWQWSGLGIASPNELWAERWRPKVIEKNQPLPFELLAPWPAERCFTAGGLNRFLIEQAIILPNPFGALFAYYYSTRPCGFGPGGFYYNQWPTHDGTEAFAIDFTRFRRFVPYLLDVAGTPVLAVRAGYVALREWGNLPGAWTSNTVHLTHPDPANPSKTARFLTRYLHLDGPYSITVSPMMQVPVGARLGLMDDTGNSFADHLHFSIHDNDIGSSVRPTPMSGVRLEDGDGGTCLCSNNIESKEDSMIEATNFVVQDWLITPAALSANEAPPNIADQKFLLVLNGVVLIDLRGTSTSEWRRETISVRPDLEAPLQDAIDRHGMPKPPGESGAAYRTAFQVEQLAPFAAVSAMYNKGASNDSGFAVDVWRPNPFLTLEDVTMTTMLTNLFEGIQVDVAVRDTDAYLHRVSYHIALLGKIVFARIRIT